MYFSFQGKKLRLYKLRGDFYALDTDVAAFFGVEKKYLLFVASKHKEEHHKNSKILLTKDEREGTIDQTKSSKPTKTVAFSVLGVMTLSSYVKSEVAYKMSVEVVRQSTSRIEEMQRAKRVSEKIKNQKKALIKTIVAMEIAKNRIPEENHDEYEKLYKGINEAIDEAHLMDRVLDLQLIEVNRVIEKCPEPFRSLFFDPAWDKDNESNLHN